jgi:hypothetical protein
MSIVLQPTSAIIQTLLHLMKVYIVKPLLTTAREDTRQTGPKDVKAIAKAPPGEGCPRCGGCVYAAEQMLAKGRVCGQQMLIYWRDHV